VSDAEVVNTASESGGRCVPKWIGRGSPEPIQRAKGWERPPSGRSQPLQGDRWRARRTSQFYLQNREVLLTPQKKRLARTWAKRFLWRCRDPSSPPRGNSSRFPSQLHTKKAPCPNMGKAFFVEVPGIEPGSFGTGTELLRAQPAALFLAPTITQASRRQAQSLLVVPHHRATRQ